MSDPQDIAEILKNFVPALETLKAQDPARYLQLVEDLKTQIEEMTKTLSE